MKKRSKVLRLCAMALAGMLVLSCCDGKEGQQKVEEYAEKLTQSISLEEIDLDSLDLSGGVWKDNSLDLYSATANYELKRSYPEGARVGGGTAVLVGNSCAYYLKKHLFEEYTQCWDEISYVDKEGNRVSNCIEINEQVWAMGAVAGSDDCLLEKMYWKEDNSIEHHIIVADKEMKSKQDIHLEFLDGEDYIILSKMMMDAVGNLHFVYNDEEKRYIITDSTGVVLYDAPLQGTVENLFLMADGRVAIKTEELQQGGTVTRYTFQYYDSTTQKMVKLAEVDAKYDALIMNVICPDETTVLFANKRGVFRGSPNNIEGATLLYEWQKHGLLVTDVWDLQYLEGDRISLICEDSGKLYYLNLEPTKEEVPIQKITLAIPSFRQADYQKVVVAFNKQYPAYSIELKTDYDQTALLTELMAGKGPVLIDTSVTGFEEQKELWLPLDKVLEKLKLTDELLLPAMEYGNIDGQLYGIVRDFSIMTVVTVGDEARNWDLDQLEKEILENSKLEALTDSISCTDGWGFMASFLLGSLEDSYFIDPQTGETRFKEPQVREVLEKIKKYYSGAERYEAGKLLEEGKVLCNPVSISRPEQLALYRMYYGEKLQYSGYPTRNGGKHFLLSSQPITIRKNASKEEITAACLFFKMLLSYEVQAETITNDMMSLSVRKDVLEEHLAAVNQDTYAYAYTIPVELFQLGDGVDHEKDKETFYHLLENASPRKGLPQELGNIFAEELTRYLDGKISVDMVLEHLANRVQLYLDEN